MATTKCKQIILSAMCVSSCSQPINQTNTAFHAKQIIGSLPLVKSSFTMNIQDIIRNARNTVLRIIEAYKQTEVKETKRNPSSRDRCLQESLNERKSRLIVDAYK